MPGRVPMAAWRSDDQKSERSELLPDRPQKVVKTPTVRIDSPRLVIGGAGIARRLDQGTE